MYKAPQFIFFIFGFFFTLAVFSQDLYDLQNLNVDDLSDAQVEAFIRRAEETGLSQQQMELLARQRGMSATQINKLRGRILKVQTGQATTNTLDAMDSRLREERTVPSMELSVFDEILEEKEDKGLKIFGKDIFSRQINFEPPANIATPVNYVLGAGDEVLIDIYGASETTYRQKISPDGKILVSGIGPISLAGMSVQEAKTVLFNRLSQIYAGLKGRYPNTFLQVSIGDIKTIQVNVVGNVERPGSYSMSSFSTAFNALYLAGGPSETGSMRSIDVFRAGEKIANLDIYKYFYSGDMTQNPTLQDQDVLVVKPFENRVVFAGQVKQPAVYEFKQKETLEDLMTISGGISANGVREEVTIFRVENGERTLSTIAQEVLDTEMLLAGDSIFVNPISNVYNNRVKLEGAVQNPGFFELKEGLSLRSLLQKGKVDRDAFLERGNIIRLDKDLSLRNLTFDLNAVLNGKEDVALQEEDIVKIASILDVREKLTVSLRGEVQNQGEFSFAKGMTVEDLITIAGGLKISANTTVIEVARRVSKDSKDFRNSFIFDFSISNTLAKDTSASTFFLEPYDLVTIKASALFRTQKTVKIEGEVMRPGVYALESETDRIADIIERAGGLTKYAYVKGGSLIRDLSAKNTSTTNTVEAINYRKQQLESLAVRDSIAQDLDPFEGREGVGIELGKALQDPKSKFNFIVEDGDVVSIPKQMQTVKIRGEVLFPTRAEYDRSNSLREYIASSGGFSQKALKRKAYVVYPNGRARRTTNFLWFKFYPKIEPGSTIFIPQKPERRKLTPGEIIGISSGLASISFIILQIVNPN